MLTGKLFVVLFPIKIIRRAEGRAAQPFDCEHMLFAFHSLHSWETAGSWTGGQHSGTSGSVAVLSWRTGSSN